MPEDPRAQPALRGPTPNLAARLWYSFNHWPTDRRGRIWAAVAASTATLLACLCTCGGLGLLIASQPSQRVGSTPSTSAPFTLAPTSTPLGPVTPTPVRTPTPQPLDGATLGGNRFNFDNVLGPPASGTGQSATWDTTLANGLPIEVAVDTITGVDGNPHVVQVIFGPQPGTGAWSQAIADAVAPQFFPPDTRAVRTVTTRQGTLDHIEVSAQLGATLPASEFVTDSGDLPVPRGTFHYLCAPSSDGGVQFCTLMPGQAQ